MTRGSGGFTLLEMMVATLIMGVAVVGLLSGISSTMGNAARLTEHDRAVLLARTKLDELLLDRKFPKNVTVEDTLDKATEGGVEGGWRARLSTFERPPGAGPGMPILEHMRLEVWWETGSGRRTFALDGYRTGILTPAEIAAQQGTP
jgi:general secretion pathway protein I